jgi:hypothetical protein
MEQSANPFGPDRWRWEAPREGDLPASPPLSCLFCPHPESRILPFLSQHGLSLTLCPSTAAPVTPWSNVPP